MTYAAIAAVLALAELAAYAVRDSRANPMDIVFTLLMCLPIAFLGAFPITGGVVYVIASRAEIAVWTNVALPALGLYVVLTSWLSRKWYWQSAVVLIAVEGPRLALAGPSSMTGGLLVATIGTTVAALVALVVRRNAGQMRELEGQLEKAERALTEAQERTKQELIAGLHDTVGRELSELAMACNAIVATGKETEVSAAQLDAIAEHARSAMNDLQLIVSQTMRSADRRAIGDIVSDCREMLGGVDIRLNATFPPDLEERVSDSRRRLVALTIEEGCFNVRKYAARGTSADLAVSLESEGSVGLVLRSDMAPAGAHEAVGYGLGLQNLSSSIRAFGGSIAFGPVLNRWTLAMELPPLAPVQTDDARNAPVND